MKKSKNEIEFVEFKICACDKITDLFCVSCDKWFCRFHKRVCVQCEQFVCDECYKQDLCCLVRPWGEKEERHLRDFYQNKLVRWMSSLEDNLKYGSNYRMKAVKRTIAYYVDTLNAPSLSCCKEEFVRDYFPNITKYVENEKTRSKFVTFMEGVFRSNWQVFCHIFLNNNVREDLLTLMDESIRSYKMMQSFLIHYSMKSKEMFGSLKNRKLLDWNLFRNEYCSIKHIDAMKWIEKNGVDVVNNVKYFKQFVEYSPAEIMEYLIVERGMTVDFMSENTYYAQQDILKMIYRTKGIEGIQKIDPRKIWKDVEEVKFLRSIDYNFDKFLISSRNNRKSRWLYALVCFNNLKYGDLSGEQKTNFDHLVKSYDIKACKYLYPFMKEIRKKKIMTVILCIRNLYPFFQKEIIWNILDLAYSPINERGSL